MLLALGFDVPAAGVLAPLGVALFLGLAISARARRAALEGFVVGLVFYGLLLRWFAAVLLDYTSLGPWIAAGAVLASGALLGLGTALVAWACARLRARFGPGAALGAGAILWVGYELARVHVPFPFPWGTLAAALATRPSARWGAALVGAWGVSLLAALIGAALAHVVFASSRRLVPLAAALAAWGLAALGGLAALPPAERSARVAVLQGSLSRDADPLDELLAYEALTRESAEAGARIVVWPESAVAYRVDRHTGYLARLETLARVLDVDLVIQSVTGGGDAPRHNSAALIHPRAGWKGRVDKRQLVPFGEYLPLRWILGDIPAIAAEAGDFEPGAGAGLLAARDGKLGPLVCYESIFPSFAREASRRGAVALVTMTNDSWFGWTHGPAQHLRHGTLRAYETGMPLLRAANSGISTIIDPRAAGPAPELGLGMRGVLVADVQLPGEAAPGAGIGAIVAIACATLSLAALVAALVSFPPRERDDGPSDRVAEAEETPDA